MTKALFFDAAGTLFDLPRGVGYHYRAVALRYGLEIHEDVFLRAFRFAWKSMPPRAAVREARPDDDRGWWRELVNRVLARCKVASGAVDREAFFAELYGEFTQPGVWRLFPEVRAVLAELGSEYHLGVISNFDGRLRQILDHLGVARCFQTIVISSEVGADKPDPWIFQRALEIAGVCAADAVHIGDDPICDWQGARTAGLRAFHLERPANSLSDLAAFVRQGAP